MIVLRKKRSFAQCAAFAIAASFGLAAASFAASKAPVETNGFETCSEEIVQITGDFGVVQFTVEVADTAQERARGLMFREHMAPFSGMLFIYEHEQSVSFWMKNTVIPLDMIFTDQNGRIASIHENAVPHDLSPIFGGDDIYAVLEVNAGVSKRLDLKIGDILQHPAYGNSTSQPCAMKKRN
jgi:uncharacterized membrane protein (UPF0127 family)